MAKLSRRLGVIGAGKMGSALIRGILKAGVLSPDQITASDADAGLLSALKQDTGIKTTPDNSIVVKSSEIILLALKPDMIRPVLQKVKGSLTKDHLIVSIAAGVPIKAIEEVAGAEARIIRVMPNTPALIGQGAAAFSPGKRATKEDVENVKTILEAVGVAVELPEKHLDAVTGLSGSGPAFVFMVIEALADGGVKMGLPNAVAMLLAAQTVAGAKHPGRHAGEVRWHGSQGGAVAIGQAKLRLQRPRLRNARGEVAVPAYAALASDGDLSRRIADILVCNVSTRKYARVVHRCAQEVGISKSAVSRQFVKESAQALAKLMSRSFAATDLVAIYVDGIIVARHHIIAAVGVDAQGNKHVLGLAPGSSENAKVVKDLLATLAERGVDLNESRLWVIAGA